MVNNIVSYKIPAYGKKKILINFAIWRLNLLGRSCCRCCVHVVQASISVNYFMVVRWVIFYICLFESSSMSNLGLFSLFGSRYCFSVGLIFNYIVSVSYISIFVCLLTYFGSMCLLLQNAALPLDAEVPAQINLIDELAQK